MVDRLPAYQGALHVRAMAAERAARRNIPPGAREVPLSALGDLVERS